MKVKSYWVYLNSHVHLNIKGNNVLFYDTVNGKVLFSWNPGVAKLAKSMMRNFYVCKISESQFLDHELKKSIMQLKDWQMADFYPVAYSTARPVQYFPFPFLEKVIAEGELMINGVLLQEPMKCLKSLSFYLDIVKSNEMLKGNINKQFPYFLSGKREQIMPVDIISKVVDLSRAALLDKITFVSGNINLHNWNQITKMVEDRSFLLNYKFPFREDQIESPILKKLCFGSKGSVTFILTGSDYSEGNEKRFKLIKKLGPKIRFEFIVDNQNQIDKLKNITETYKIKNFELVPYYTGNNYNLFEKHVFTGIKEIEGVVVSMKELHEAMLLNPSDFGRLNILPNGVVFANFNNPKLGNVNSSSIHKLIIKELESKKGWLKTRAKVKPCNACVFQYVCAGVSNYEYALKRHNLCNIYPA